MAQWSDDERKHEMEKSEGKADERDQVGIYDETRFSLQDVAFQFLLEELQ